MEEKKGAKINMTLISKKNRHGKIIKNQGFIKIEDNNNNISVVNEDDKIEDKIEKNGKTKLKDDKKENGITKRCCLLRKNNHVYA